MHSKKGKTLSNLSLTLVVIRVHFSFCTYRKLLESPNPTNRHREQLADEIDTGLAITL
jgi:hypothetical protein